MQLSLQPVDKVEILTLTDNGVDLLADDMPPVVQRYRMLQSIFAEHGFAAVITLTRGGRSRNLLFDFGFSSGGAAHNGDVMGVRWETIEAAMLSHGHLDHFGGMAACAGKIGRTGMELVLHPEAFRAKRGIRISADRKAEMPPFTREMVRDAGLTPMETRDPAALLDGEIVFLGEIPGSTPFEQPAPPPPESLPRRVYERDGRETWDDLKDDSGVAIHLKGKGLVVISGCAHAGIINTVHHARAVSGIETVHAVMGGFHLAGRAMQPVVGPTIAALKGIDPDYVVPTHCTGRDAVNRIEAEMPGRFISNLAGTKLTFAS